MIFNLNDQDLTDLGKWATNEANGDN